MYITYNPTVSLTYKSVYKWDNLNLKERERNVLFYKASPQDFRAQNIILSAAWYNHREKAVSDN